MRHQHPITAQVKIENSVFQHPQLLIFIFKRKLNEDLGAYSKFRLVSSRKIDFEGQQKNNDDERCYFRYFGRLGGVFQIRGCTFQPMESGEETFYHRLHPTDLTQGLKRH